MHGRTRAVNSSFLGKTLCFCAARPPLTIADTSCKPHVHHTCPRPGPEDRRESEDVGSEVVARLPKAERGRREAGMSRRCIAGADPSHPCRARSQRPRESSAATCRGKNLSMTLCRGRFLRKCPRSLWAPPQTAGGNLFSWVLSYYFLNPFPVLM